MTPLDLPAVLLDAIHQRPENAAGWHTLADWLWVHGRDDEAVAVRVLWPTLRENLSCDTPEATLADVTTNAKVLADVAREFERRAADGSVGD